MNKHAIPHFIEHRELCNPTRNVFIFCYYEKVNIGIVISKTNIGYDQLMTYLKAQIRHGYELLTKNKKIPCF